jgi:hypothetical protein
MSWCTIFLSRLIGLYSLITSLSMLLHKAAMVETVAELAHAPPLLLIGGMITLLSGLAIVIGHNVWGRGLLPLVITVLGWVLLLRGIILVFISPGGAAALYEVLHFEQLYYLYVAVPLALGLYLTGAGFKAQAA